MPEHSGRPSPSPQACCTWEKRVSDRHLLNAFDLEDEILATEAAYVAGAITEIASLRARLGGRQWG